MPINWETTAEEVHIIRRIALKYVELVNKPLCDLRSAVMDITAVHANGCPLRLEEMAEAAEAKTGDFTHDAIGIYVHLERETGTLKNFFVPRYAQTERKGS
ncbi:hypothetical protein [Edaphobacter modestus]|uniref:DUF6874 domain-containing protein n=1 Tax=Edaphobacter modestus TaxID=388466 RepID=A0A4Q7XX39_9BACT|nr:hypothetical protein [Edaphobacter modestus]RZU28937.1 hypothetical protein BDD14_6522 [Edaphobacter modestus]